jgi:hypothetical protein
VNEQASQCHYVLSTAQELTGVPMFIRNLNGCILEMTKIRYKEVGLTYDV